MKKTQHTTMPTLNWIGKEKVINHHQDVPYRILEKQYTYANGKETNSPPLEGLGEANKIIHGDNLEALKSLLPEYEGKIKCIYIDPPYNTGNEGWVYNDNVNHPKLKKWLGQVVGKESEDLSRHDKWLCMMYPRLKLLHKLLADDGVIFISIDDAEYTSIRILIDEIFGKTNFIGNICHKSRSSISNDLLISQNHHYLLCFAKKFNEIFKAKRNFRLPQEYKGFKNPDNDPNGSYKLVPVDGPGGAAKGNPYYTFKGVTGYWRYSEETMNELYEKGEIIVKPKSLSRKYYLTKAKQKGGATPTTWWDDAGTATNGTRLLKEIFNGEKVFDTPKPIEFLERVCNLGLWGDNPIILDSFAGSGTTAHAVLNLNKQDGGNRKFILVEMEDYANTITAKRVKRVINGYGTGNKTVEGTSGDFTYYELGQPLFLDNELLNEEVGKEKIEEYVWYTEAKAPYKPKEEQYLLGSKNDTAYYFYYEKNRLTTLDESFLRTLKTKANQYMIYADLCLLDQSLMDKYHIVFKKYQET